MRDGMRDRFAGEEFLQLENVIAQAGNFLVLRFGDAPDEQADFAGILREISRNLLTNEKISLDRKSTRLNSSHVAISYAVFCLKKKKKKIKIKKNLKQTINKTNYNHNKYYQ